MAVVDDGTEIIEEDTSKLILERLNAFGDSLLDDDYREKKKTTKKKNRNETNQGNGFKRKKKKKKLNSSEEEVNADNGDAKSQKTNKLSDFDKEIEMFKESEDLKKEDKAKVAKRKKKKLKPKNEVEVIVFNDPSKRKKKQEEEKVVVNPRDGIMSLKKAKIDVHQFGLSGFDYEDKEKMEMQRAIRLGARPPRKEYMNYKELIKKQKEQREADANQREINRKLGIKVIKKPEKIVLKHKGFWVDPTQQRGVYIDGQVGKFRRGMQIVNKKDLKIKSSKSKTFKKTAIKL